MESKKFNIFSFLLRIIFFIFLLFIIVDISRVIIYQVRINNIIPEINVMYNEHKSNEDIAKYTAKYMNKAVIDINEENKFVEYIVSYKVKIVTPVINVLFDGYEVSAKSVINKE